MCHAQSAVAMNVSQPDLGWVLPADGAGRELRRLLGKGAFGELVGPGHEVDLLRNVGDGQVKIDL